MGLFAWLFGRGPKQISQQPENPHERKRHFVYDAPDRSAAIGAPEPTAPIRRPVGPPKPPTSGDIFDLDYSAGGGHEKLRRVTFLFGTPGAMVTAIDLGKRRVRTYRIDRMKRILRPSDQQAYEPWEFFRNYSVIGTSGWHANNEDQTVAAEMRKEMFCQLSLLVLMATADGPLTEDRLDRIMKYAQRENRFATREGWVSKGDKRGVWPVLREMIRELQPRRDQIDIYVGTLRENWENPRRFAALNDAISELANLGPGPSASTRALAEAINSVRV